MRTATSFGISALGAAVFLLTVDEAKACSCDQGWWAGYPVDGATDLPRDAMVRCGYLCPDGTELVDESGTVVPGAWTTVKMDSLQPETHDGEGPFHRIFKPSALLSAQKTYALRDSDGVQTLSFETGQHVLDARPSVPVMVFPPWEPWDVSCFTGADSCYRIGLNFTLSLALELDPERTESLFLDIDCVAVLEPDGRGGRIAAIRDATNFAWLSTGVCGLEGLFPVSPGQTIFARYAALGKNGRLSAWSEVLKIHIPEACGDIDQGASPIEVSFAGDETPAGCALSPGPPDDGPLPTERLPDAGSPTDGGTEQEPRGEDRNGLGCSSSGDTGPLAFVFSLLFAFVRRRQQKYQQNQMIGRP